MLYCHCFRYYQMHSHVSHMLEMSLIRQMAPRALASICWNVMALNWNRNSQCVWLLCHWGLCLIFILETICLNCMRVRVCVFICFNHDRDLESPKATVMIKMPRVMDGCMGHHVDESKVKKGMWVLCLHNNRTEGTPWHEELDIWGELFE